MPDDSDAVGRMHVDLASRFEHDKRIRALEIGQASTDAHLAALASEVHGLREDNKADKGELLAAISANRPEPPWKAMAAIVGLITVVFVIAGAIYGTNVQ